MTLTIEGETLERVFVAAANASGNECMGLLASERASAAITHMCLLPATASATHAEAAPLALRQNVEQMLAKGLIPRGIWHSHGAMSVFHSGTDHATMERLLPAMAPWNFERPPHAVTSPAVTAPDSAVLPLNDGRLMVFTIIGEPLPGGYGHELGRWGGMSTHFVGKPSTQPRASFDGAKLDLESNGIRIELAIAEGATVQICVDDKAPYRTSTLYSLVVNTRRDRFAECLEVMEFGGRCQTRVAACEVLTIGDRPEDDNKESFPSFLRALVGR
jgi:proteasome lid subunit RPN8/RPN11